MPLTRTDGTLQDPKCGPAMFSTWAAGPGLLTAHPYGQGRPGVACGDECDRLAARRRPRHPLAGAGRPRERVPRRRRGRAGPGRARRLGCAPPLGRGSRWPLGGRRVLPGVLPRRRARAALDGDDAHPAGATGASAEVRTARRSGAEYLLARGLFRRKSTGEVVARHISSSRSPTTGTTTYYVRSTTSAGRAQTLIPGWRRPWTSCDRSGSPTADGCSTASTPAASTSTARAAPGRRAGSTPCAPCGCSTGGTAPPSERFVARATNSEPGCALTCFTTAALAINSSRGFENLVSCVHSKSFLHGSSR